MDREGGWRGGMKMRNGDDDVEVRVPGFLCPLLLLLLLFRVHESSCRSSSSSPIFSATRLQGQDPSSLLHVGLLPTSHNPHKNLKSMYPAAPLPLPRPSLEACMISPGSGSRLAASAAKVDTKSTCGSKRAKFRPCQSFVKEHIKSRGGHGSSFLAP